MTGCVGSQAAAAQMGQVTGEVLDLAGCQCPLKGAMEQGTFWGEE